MKMKMLCAMIGAAIAMPAHADIRYDRRLEQAVKAIVAAKIGDIRGGFAFDIDPLHILIRAEPSRDAATTGSVGTASAPGANLRGSEHATF
jgi:hypothetical protein